MGRKQQDNKIKAPKVNIDKARAQTKHRKSSTVRKRAPGQRVEEAIAQFSTVTAQVEAHRTTKIMLHKRRVAEDPTRIMSGEAYQTYQQHTNRQPMNVRKLRNLLCPNARF